MDDGSSRKSGPRTRVCYICGRQYGLSSYEIHLKQCKELFLAREAKKDPKERKKLPEDPLLALSSPGASLGNRNTSSPAKDFGAQGEVDLDEINRLASATFNAETLDTCKFCGRTFLAEKLVIHNRSCTSDNPARRVNEAVKKGQKDIVQEPPQTAPAGSRRVKFTRTASMKRASVAGEEGDGAEEEDLVAAINAKEKESFRSSGVSKSRPAAEIQGNNEEDTMGMGSTVNLQIQNGSMAVVQGSMGGSGARSIRKQQQSSPSPSKSDSGIGTQRKKATELIASFQDKQEVIGYLTENLDFMENTALGLMHSISEMKNLLKELSSQH